jgi:hypothetical protein
MSDVSVDGFLADSVAAVDGKLYCLGAGWNRIFVPSFPARHDRVGVGLLFRLSGGSPQRQRRFAIRVETPSGAALTLATGPSGAAHAIEGGFTTGGEGEITVPFALQLDGLPLETPGRYAVIVSLDGDDVKTLAFHVQTQRRSDPDDGGAQATATAGYL